MSCSNGWALSASTYTVTGAAKRWDRRASNRKGVPSGLLKSGSPYFSLALLLVTRAWLFWMVAVGPENTAIFGFWARAYFEIAPAKTSTNSRARTEQHKARCLIPPEDRLSLLEFIAIISVSSFLRLPKPGQPLRALRELLRQHLDVYLPLGGVLSTVGLSHAALADLLDDLAVAEGTSDHA